MQTIGYLLALAVGLLIGTGLGAGLFWLVNRNTSRSVDTAMRDAFDALARQALRDNANMFLDRTKSELEPLGQSLDTLDQRIRELEQKREGAYGELQEQLRQLGRTQHDLQQTTTSLSQALRSPTARGQWGELQLRRIVELAGMVEHVDFDEQQAAGDGRPDLIVRLPNGGILPVDAKTPMNAYLDAVNAPREQMQRDKLEAHAKAVRSRIRELSRKRYWEQFNRAPQFVILFVPYESCLGAAFEQDEDLLDYALQSHVVVTSPVTLLALLKAVAYGWQQVSVTENARQIAEEGRELYRRLSILTGHIDDVGTNLGRAVDAFNSLIGSMERRLLPSARRFQELEVDKTDPPALHSVDQTPRRITAEELRHTGRPESS
ncbi:MAG: DNA recombination protein RmuC [Anaerolineae bacterium]|jgi:DNA recombination protein RmuC